MRAMKTRLLPFLLLCYACAPQAPLDDGAEGAADPAELDAAAVKDATLVSSESKLSGAGKLRITMVDVGQGDGILVQTPSGGTIVIDGGPRNDTMADYLRAQGIKKVDYIILSHAHDDHYSGLTEVMTFLPNDCKKRVLDPGYNNDPIGYQDFRDAAGCQYSATRAGQTLALDTKMEISVIGADSTPPTDDGSHGVNNTSVVLKLRYGDFSMLLDGDAEVEAEQGLTSRARALLRSTVLKAGHHGSCTASGTTYLKAVAPQFMVMSVGAGNSYGLPHCQTMNKLRGLKQKGLRWLRTDVNGAIRIASDGKSYAVTPSRGAESVASCPRDCNQPLDY